MIKLSKVINLESIRCKCTGDLMMVIMNYMENVGFDAIDWEDALNFLRYFSKHNDKYNIYPVIISNKDELLDLHTNICKAMIGKAPMISRICTDCRKRFYIYLPEKSWLESKGFPLPKRCKGCRKLRNKIREEAEYNKGDKRGTLSGNVIPDIWKF